MQLAVLGFIGLCGALQSGAASSEPKWLQQLAAILVLLALAIACLATVLVAGAAWPVGGWRRGSAGGRDLEAEVQRGGRHLRTGIVLTFVAVGLVALATSSSWWPNYGGGGGQLVEVSTAQGTLCGTLVDSDGGALAVEVGGQRLALAHGPGRGRAAGRQLLAAAGSGRADADVPGLEVLLDAFPAALAAEAGVLDAAERRGRVGDHALVDADHAGVELLGEGRASSTGRG